MLEGEGLYGGPEHKVFVRVGHSNGAIYLDLGDAAWRMVEVTAEGWRTIAVTQAPVRFRRSGGMLALPEPVPGGSLNELQRFINIRDDANFVLCCSWLIGALQPCGPYPLLVLNGEQGSAKTFTCRVLRRLIDPNKADVRSQPRDERDLVIAGNNGWVIALDNLSYVQPALSDALCRIATGGGFATRALWTDADEKIFSLQRPIIVNGIEELVTRPDLLDRAIALTLPPIAEIDRRDEAELWADFEAARPRIIGALLTAVSAALRQRGKVQLDRLPRMADFAKWAVAAENGSGVPWRAGEFLEAYMGNRAAAVDSAIEASAIGPALMAWFAEREVWTGTATELLTELETITNDRVTRGKTWPKTGRGVSGALRRLAPCLRVHGVAVTWNERNAHARTLRLESVASQPSQPSPSSSNPTGAPKKAVQRSDVVTVDDGRLTGDDGCREMNSHPETPLSAQENAACDGSDDDDGLLRTQSSGQGGRPTDHGLLNDWGNV